MTYKLHETVVLTRDVPEQRLCRGDLGAVVAVHGDEELSVEFVLASGKTHALADLSAADVRAVEGTDMPSVRCPGAGRRPISEIPGFGMWRDHRGLRGILARWRRPRRT
jgi:hypothetical protein